MQPLDPAWVGPPDDADAARARLAAGLRHHGGPLSRSVASAFARVPRHIFVPEVGPAAAYRDEALVIKCGPDGLPVSSSSQPAMMAIMLGQLGLRAGDRVLEIGTGSGYNAAVMSEVIGPDGEVVSVDIDPELVARARGSLADAGYDRVLVLCADGGFGDPDRAPFDRIIVTAGAWDIAPAWLDQLVPGGLLVLPLSVRGIQLSVALRRDGGRWMATSAWRCGFVKMLGAYAGPETVFQAGGPRALVGLMADGAPADVSAIQAALAGPAVDERVHIRVPGLADLADLDLWLTIAAAGLDRITVLAAPGGWFPMASLLPLGGLVSDATTPGQLGVAVLAPATVARDQPARPGSDVLIRGFGPGGTELTGYLSGLVRDWVEAGRPGTQNLELTVWPASASGPRQRLAASAGIVTTLQRPSVWIEAGWPAARAAG